MFVHGKYFNGNEISNYGQEHGYVDYATLAKSFDAVLNNEIMEKTYEIGYWEQESGFVDNSDEIEELQEKFYELDDKRDALYHEQEENINNPKKYYELDELAESITDEMNDLQEKIDELEEEQEDCPEIYQYYIVSDNGAEILKEINEIVFYNEELDMYIWGVTHYGTSWSYVLTDIPCNVPYEELENI